MNGVSLMFYHQTLAGFRNDNVPRRHIGTHLLFIWVLGNPNKKETCKVLIPQWGFKV